MVLPACKFLRSAEFHNPGGRNVPIKDIVVCESSSQAKGTQSTLFLKVHKEHSGLSTCTIPGLRSCLETGEQNI